VCTKYCLNISCANLVQFEAYFSPMSKHHAMNTNGADDRAPRDLDLGSGCRWMDGQFHAPAYLPVVRTVVKRKIPALPGIGTESVA
jgi:hypothetical protein